MEVSNMVVQGVIDSTADLPLSANEGDVWIIAGKFFAMIGGRWQRIGSAPEGLKRNRYCISFNGEIDYIYLLPEQASIFATVGFPTEQEMGLFSMLYPDDVFRFNNLRGNNE